MGQKVSSCLVATLMVIFNLLSPYHTTLFSLHHLYPMKDVQNAHHSEVLGPIFSTLAQNLIHTGYPVLWVIKNMMHDTNTTVDL